MSEMYQERLDAQHDEIEALKQQLRRAFHMIELLAKLGHDEEFSRRGPHAKLGYQDVCQEAMQAKNNIPELVA